MGKTRAAKRRARRKAAKAKTAKAPTGFVWPKEADEGLVQKPEELCEICAHPFKDSGPDEDNKYDVHVRVWPFEWKQRGCQCPDPKWCMGCCRHLVLTEAKRCCLNPGCDGVILPCPWCRVNVNVADLYIDFNN